MRKFLMLLLFLLVASAFFACGPKNDDEKPEDGVTAGEDGVFLEDDFESETLSKNYTVVDGELDGETTESWTIGGVAGYDSKVACVYFGADKYNNDSRLELITLDLTGYKKITFAYDYCVGYRYAMTTEHDGGEHVIEGGYDLQVCVSVDGGNWEIVWHEADDPNLTSDYDGTKFLHYDLDLSDYAGKNKVKLAVWDIGKDGDKGSIDNIKLTGTK